MGGVSAGPVKLRVSQLSSGHVIFSSRNLNVNPGGPVYSAHHMHTCVWLACPPAQLSEISGLDYWTGIVD